MPRVCVAGGCRRTTSDGVSLFVWPKDHDLRKKWTDFVMKTRKWTGPSKWSTLCSAHFEEDYFEEIHQMALHFGYKRKLKLSAIPTIDKPIFADKENVKPTEEQTSILYSPLADAYADPTYATAEASLSTTEEFSEQTAAQAMLELSSSYALYSNVTDTFEDDVNIDASHSFSQVLTSTPKLKKTNSSSLEKRNISKILRDIELGQSTLPRKTNRDQCTNKNSFNKSRSKRTKQSRGIQVTTTVEDKAIQCNLITPIESCEEVFSESESEAGTDVNDLEYDPLTEDPDSDESFSCQSEATDTVEGQDRYFLVSESCLLKLFDICPHCHSECDRKVQRTVGSCVFVGQRCQSCTYVSEWTSQPYISDIPAGNLMMSAAMLFSGAAISKILRFLDHLCVPNMSYQTFLNHQNRYLQPAITSVWKTEQQSVVERIQTDGGEFSAVGDGRADSPGHSAKYGTYTLLDSDHNKIVRMEVVTVTEVTSSNAMEKEGLIRAIQHIEQDNLILKELTTDRHTSIRKYIREEKADIKHSFDVWHTSKGIGKKIDSFAKKKEFKHLKDWKKSIVNHMYWCASSSQNSNPDVMVAKWMSVANHIQNIHTHEDNNFPKCLHPPLANQGRKKKWLQPNHQATEKLCDLLLSKSTLKDVRMLSTGQQTANLESFHAIINHFAPKLTCFSHRGMVNRMMLAALHYNENSDRTHAKTREGEGRYVVTYPKYKEGLPTVKKVLVSCTYNYVKALKYKVVQIAMGNIQPEMPGPGPPTITSKFEKIDKGVAISNHRSRFIKSTLP